MDCDQGGLTLFDFLTVDTISSVFIEQITTRKGDTFNLEKPNVRVGFDVSNTAVIEADAGKVNYFSYQNTSGNLLVNPSFEAGRYLWVWSVVPQTTEEYIESEIGDGLMGHFVFNAPSNSRLEQTVAVPAAWLGQAMTVSAKVKISGGTVLDFLSIRVGNTGITENTQYFPRVSGRTSEWQQIVFTFEHQTLSASGKVGFRIQVAAGVDVYIDEVSYTFGNEGIPNLSNMRSLTMDDRVVTYGAAAPTTGTWVRGSIVFNDTPSAAGTVGFVCVTAGSPGTWKTFGTIAA